MPYVFGFGLPMATEKSTLLIRPKPKTKDALRKAAIDSDRSMSWIADKAIEEWLERNGYLPEPRKKK
jgi:hypothetical protein